MIDQFKYTTLYISTKVKNGLMFACGVAGVFIFLTVISALLVFVLRSLVYQGCDISYCEWSLYWESAYFGWLVGIGGTISTAIAIQVRRSNSKQKRKNRH